MRVVHETGAAAARSSSDALTGLLNRNGLEDELRRLAKAGEPFSLALADVDNLREINESHGIEGGDNALVMFATVLRSTLRGADLLARFGGEEFALVFPGADADDAAKFLERIQFALGGALATGEAPHFTVSYGVADTLRSNGVEGALGDAEAALLLAKASGRNRIVVARRDA
ncbi:MAG: GGDEF domain-containing protein [Actinobacteria bacterium]|nr:GGDEF domain-containing protein [Actinomycetota bacterium]